MQTTTQIKSPRGIRFDCSGCSNCCLQWPVPLTQSDFDKIADLNLSTEGSTRILRSKRENLLSFTHTLEKKTDGSCQFLTNEKLCYLHQEFGVESKPSMCLLFPYSFTVTPNEVLASLSFASSAVLCNSGNLLSQQAETLEFQFRIFQDLFKPKRELWHKLQLVDGQLLDWESFTALDKQINAIIEGDETDPAIYPDMMERRLKEASDLLVKQLPDPALAEREPKLEARPRIADQILLKHLERLYFPQQVFLEDNYDLKAKELMVELVAAPKAVSFGQGQESLKFAELINIKLGKLPDDVEGLFNRFFYVRFFSKLYFGPGFHHFSLIAGMHHLRTLQILLRLKIKQSLCLSSKTKADFELACELVRTMERRLTQLDLSAQSVAMLEVMLSSVERQTRIKFLAE